MVWSAGADAGTTKAGKQCVQLRIECCCFGRGSPRDVDDAKPGMTIQGDMKQDIGNGVVGIHLCLGVDFTLEVTFLAKVVHQTLSVLFDVGSIEGRLGREVGNLNQFGVWKSLSAGELKDAEVDGGLENEQDPNSIRFGIDLELHLLELAGRLQSRDALIDFLPGEGLTGLLNELMFKFGSLESGLAGNFDGGYILTFIGREDFLGCEGRSGDLLCIRALRCRG